MSVKAKAAVSAVFVIVSLLVNQSAAVAHTESAAMNIGLSDEAMRNVFWLMCFISGLLIVKTAKQVQAIEGPKGPALINQALINQLASILGVVALTAFIILCLFVKDPFGFLSRLAYLWWFLIVMIGPWSITVIYFFSPLHIWGKWRDSSKKAQIPTLFARCKGAGIAAVFSWYFLAYENWTKPHSLAALFIAYAVVTAVAVTKKHTDPLIAAFDYQRNPLSQIVIVGALIFALLKDQAWWARTVNADQGWNTVVWTLWMAGCIGIVAVACWLTAIVMQFVAGVKFKSTISALTQVGPLLIAGLAVGQLLVTVISSMQDELYVLWDPFNQGWRPFGPEQGLNVQLLGNWVDPARAMMVIAATLLGQWIVVSAVKRDVLSVDGSAAQVALPFILLVSVLGYGTLHYLGGA